MINVSKFVKESTPLCMCSLGIAILGYIGYHVVRSIIIKCHKTEKIDLIAQKAIGPTPLTKIPSKNQMIHLDIVSPSSKNLEQSHEIQLDEIALKHKSENQRVLAATKIQSIYRGHVARLALKRLQEESLKGQEPTANVKIKQQNLSEIGGMATIDITPIDFCSRINEVVEKMDEEGRGYRIFPNGTKEWGRLDQDKQFICAYRIDSNENAIFVAPEEIIGYIDKSSSEYVYESVTELEGELIVLEELFDDSKNGSHYVLGKTPLVTLVWNAATEAYTLPNTKHLKKLLNHKSFAKHLPGLIEKALILDKFGVPQLFSLPERAIIKIIVIGDHRGHINPLSVGNFFIYAADSKNYKLVEKLTELFPIIFQSIAEEVIEKLIICGYAVSDVQNLISKMSKKPDYYDLWLEIAKKKPPTPGFNKEFDTLSSKNQRLLYQAAFAYNNTFLHEPADLSITPEQYSINLMWINKFKMPVEQEFLFGDGSSFEDRESDFKKRFISPVSEWAKKNPGSFINIWIDSEMANSQAVDRSRTALESALEGTLHGKIQFRDVRTIDTVTSNPQVFSEKVSVYFRVDLLRAIAADHILRSKENQFFVYGDIDMEPLSQNELFDKRTVTFLDDFGFVMAKGGHLGFENGFQIFSGNNQKFMDSHRKVIINLSIEMALEKPSAIKEQQVYDTYPAMVTHFLDVDGRYGKLKSLKKGLRQFRYDNWKNTAHETLPLGDGRVELREVMPRKPVRLPVSHF